MRKIKVIVKRPDEEYGHMTNISDSLKNLQKTVEGYIEMISIGGNTCIICNEEGKLRNLRPNFRTENDIICGTVIIAGTNEDELDDVPISFGFWKEILDSWGN
ncbi:MAG: DUF3846 domain-containing protein [Firmicutes bacterium]|nr:DUF3846 domain-containing protein [Bacillota bacterium]